ncbi:hypothetical protein [Falsirhodobacter sp. 1013]|uniref:hypothetical protein n=1 Tax=Falsirhodobacter sp. 1013 TaxID=3417566 RepID=UPI003EBA2502
MASGFAATISAWAAATKQRQTAVFRSSAQRVANEVRQTVNEGGRMPIKTGNLRRSLLASTTALPTVSTAKDFSDQSGEITLTIGTAELGQTVYLGFQAAYARRLNNGFVGEDSKGRSYNQEGYHFIEGVAQQWQRIVSEEAVKLQGQVAGAFARP